MPRSISERRAAARPPGWVGVWLLVVLSLLVSTGLVEAAEVRMRVQKSAESFFVGQEFQYEILISGATRVQLDEPDESEGLGVQFVEKITMGDLDPPALCLRFRMVPMQPGMVQLPVISFEADGQFFSTDEEDFIQVSKPKSYPGLALQRDVTVSDVYLGQTFRVDYCWQSPLPLNGFRAVQLHLPWLYDSAFHVRAPHHWIDPDDKAAVGFPVSNTRLITRYGQSELGGQFLNQLSFAKLVTPLKAGEFRIPAASLLGSYVTPPAGQRQNRGWKTNYPSYFNNNFFETVEGERYTQYYMASPSHSLRVLPLPDEGKPDDFAGQVGRRQVQVSASPLVVRAGDPITLTIVVDDCEFPETVEIPELGGQLAFSRQFSMPAKQSEGRVETRRKTFVRTLRPRGQDVTRIPAIRLPYFDPVSKRYVVASSEPIPITVNAAETATAFDAQISGSGPLRNVLQANGEGIRANYTQLDQRGWLERKLGTALLVVVFGPPLIWLLFFGLSYRSRLVRRDPVRGRAMAAWKHFDYALKRIDWQDARTDQTLKSFEHALQCYFADKLNLVSHAHTIEELAPMLEGKLDAESLAEITRLYRQLDAHGYGKSEVLDPELLSQMQASRQIISTIDKQI